MGKTYAIILNFYWSIRICLKITKMARPHRRLMSKRPDCYELMMGQRHRRWAIIKKTLFHLTILCRESPAEIPSEIKEQEL